MDMLMGVLAVIFGVVSAFSQSVRTSCLSLWCCGLSLSGLYLSNRAEFLAFSQSLLATVVCLSFFFFSEMYEDDFEEPDRTKLSLAVVTGFILMVGCFAGLRGSGKSLDPEASRSGLTVIGEYILNHQIVSLEILSLTIFLVIIGVGVVTRVKR